MCPGWAVLMTTAYIVFISLMGQATGEKPCGVISHLPGKIGPGLVGVTHPTLPLVCCERFYVFHFPRKSPLTALTWPWTKVVLSFLTAYFLFFYFILGANGPITLQEVVPRLPTNLVFVVTFTFWRIEFDAPQYFSTAKWNFHPN